MSKEKWTTEYVKDESVWPIKFLGVGVGYFYSDTNAHQAVDALNAMDRIKDPKKFMDEIKQALKFYAEPTTWELIKPGLRKGGRMAGELLAMIEKEK